MPSLRLDIVVEPWIDGLWSPLSNLLRASSSEADSIPISSMDAVTDMNPSVSESADSVAQWKERVDDGSGLTPTGSGGDKGGLSSIGDDGVIGEESGTTDRVNVVPRTVVKDDERVSEQCDSNEKVNSEIRTSDTGLRKGKEINEKSSTATEFISNLISDILENLALSNSSPTSAKVEGRDAVPTCTDSTVDDLYNVPHITALKTCLSGLTGSGLSLPSVPPAYLQVHTTKVWAAILLNLAILIHYLLLSPLGFGSGQRGGAFIYVWWYQLWL